MIPQRISGAVPIMGILLRTTLTNNRHLRMIHHLVKKHMPTISKSDLINFSDLEALQKNIKSRKTSGNIEKLKMILKNLENTQLDETSRTNLGQQLHNELLKFPNQTHPIVSNYEDEPVELQQFNVPDTDELSTQKKTFSEIAKIFNILRMEHLGNFTGHKSYYLMDALAEMEHALIKYTWKHLNRGQFQLISVPDILPPNIIQGCGMQTTGERTQVYKLEKNEKCLSGTSEMALAGYFEHKTLNFNELPIKLASVSRCFRAETSGLQEEKGIYRVHQFTKVEMFCVCAEEQSEEMLESFKHIEIELFKKLGIYFRLLDMPPCELGAPAYRKYDIEAWMPGRKMWGEISSCSNCTDYQAKRLNIKYKTKDGKFKYAHTVNGTACAIPRMLIALIETFQNENGTIAIPKVLQHYFRGTEEIMKKKTLPELKLVKNIEAPKQK